jgi:phosphosulfolactate phosphohydrolase-like enzyme
MPLWRRWDLDLQPPRPVTGAVVEVFRAFTTAAVALANGAAGIVMVRTIEEALALPRRRDRPELCGRSSR